VYLIGKKKKKNTKPVTELVYSIFYRRSVL
jgi:hypothetical protein